MRKYIVTILPLMLLFTCKSVIKKEETETINYLAQYDFNKPTAIIELDKELKEISGISFINDSLIAAISDGKPYLYIYSLSQQQIINRIKVADNGDFEDVAIVGNRAFVMQSNGMIWTINDFNGKPFITSDSLPLAPPFELEGLCINQAKDSLFFAAKYWHDETESEKNDLPVWAYSIKTKKINAAPAISISTMLASEKRKHLFHTSGILQMQNPFAWIAISTNKKYIAQLDRQGKRIDIISLDREEFTQPEGIAINSAGNIYISNEGKDGSRATILQFDKIKTQ